MDGKAVFLELSESPSDTRSTRGLFWIADDPLEFLAEPVCTAHFPRHLPTDEGEFAGGSTSLAHVPDRLNHQLGLISLDKVTTFLGESELPVCGALCQVLL